MIKEIKHYGLWGFVYGYGASSLFILMMTLAIVIDRDLEWGIIYLILIAVSAAFLVISMINIIKAYMKISMNSSLKPNALAISSFVFLIPSSYLALTSLMELEKSLFSAQVILLTIFFIFHLAVAILSRFKWGR